MKRWNRFSSQIIYSKISPGHLESSFGNPAKNLSPEAQKRRKISSGKKIVLEPFLWEFRIKFWQPSREKSADGPKHFCWKCKKTKQIVFLGTFYASPKRSSEHISCSFDNSARNNSLKVQFFCWELETDKK